LFQGLDETAHPIAPPSELPLNVLARVVATIEVTHMQDIHDVAKLFGVRPG